MLNAIARTIKVYENDGENCTPEVSVTLEDFATAADKLVPSVSEDDLAYYKNFQIWIVGKGVLSYFKFAVF